VPTSLTGRETARELWQGLKSLLDELSAKGFDRTTLARQALVTPACGLGSLSREQAETVLDLTREVSELARREFA
jgi:methionine synthase II (cobalamin-independent)